MSGKKPKKSLNDAESFFKGLPPKQRATIISDIQNGALIVARQAVATDRQAQARKILRQELPNAQARIAPAIDFLKWDLEKRIEQRKTDPTQSLHIHIGDFNHASPIPGLVQLAALNIATPHGNPVLVVEEASGSQEMKKEFDALAKDPTLEGAHLAKANSYLANGTIDKNRILHHHRETELIQHAAQGVPIIFPDPRGQSRQVATFSEEEARLLSDWRTILSKTDPECYSQAREAFRKTLTEEQKQIIDTADKKYRHIINDGEAGHESFIKLDETISDTITREAKALKLANPILVTEYGGAHFMKKLDINEHIKGTYLAVIPDASSARGPKFEALAEPTIYNNFPKAAFYYEEPDPSKRLLIMDTGTLKSWYKDKHGKNLTDTQAENQVRANQAAFLQITPDQFTQWEKARDGDKEAQAEIRKLLEVSPEAKLACEPQVQAAVAPLLSGPMGAAMSTWRVQMPGGKDLEGSPSAPLQPSRPGQKGGRRDPGGPPEGVGGR